MWSDKVRTGIHKIIRFWLETRRPSFLSNFGFMLNFVCGLCFELVKGESRTPKTI